MKIPSNERGQSIYCEYGMMFVYYFKFHKLKQIFYYFYGRRLWVKSFYTLFGNQMIVKPKELKIYF